MLPRQKARLQEQLLLWGYPPHIVENMEVWSLLSHYNYELKKREQQMLAEQDSEYETTTLETEVEKPKQQYKGVKVPYRW
ncbi:hypothetical protein [Pelotomaculum propionicicum]|uniref:Uncharacterized protein n=1 Tax=Pelotomaculum propionicicum TaxID=258475 RepID=A0A4Y7RRX8_9FIRM|nr:hypothetical protein [Pelotomaculum propionicicum]NLI13901.1 hypothetical protein [Peptococcaceae bacterium]TEB11027.1 hypothetical protein Pmgp_01899 [Pelotomaculum propionicicum]